jgi:cell division protein ZapE
LSDGAARDGPLWAYRAKRRSGELKPDPAQELAAEKLQSLFNAIRHYQPETGQSGWKERLGLGRRRRAEPPQGLYLFHAFMQEVHDRLHAWRAKTKGQKSDPLPELAGELADEAWLICFDEFHVVNIADAMILRRLFESLFARGAVVVATSNWPPDQLYTGGLQRDRFLPFVDLLKERLDILELDGGTDYRRRRMQDISVYHAPLGPRATTALDEAFGKLTEGAVAEAEELEIKGRSLPVPLAARGVARFSFAGLCEEPLGSGDYLAVAGAFHTLVLDGVPVLNADKHDVARRFMTLVDVLYEHRVKLIIAAAAPPERLYPTGDGVFEFERTVSRLQEMRSKEYIALGHLGP